ncbi:MAG: ABC transporter permease [Anaerolineae bacterium]|nr:ABC transporter permease [Anaerolineae bacterium]
MSFRDLLHLVISNLGRMKARVAMTAIGVVIGTAAVIVLVSLAAGLQRSATEDLGSIGELTEITVFPGSFLTSFGASPSQTSKEAVLNDRTLDEFRDLPGVAAVTPRESLMGGGTLRLNRLLGGAQIVGLDPTQVEHLDFALASGTERLGRWQALVGARVAEGFYDPRTGRSVAEPHRGGVVVVNPPRTGRPPEEAPDLQGQALQLVLTRMGDDGHPVERIARLRVTGVLEESGGQDDYTLYLALSDVLELNGWFAGHRPNPGREGYNQVLVKVADPEQALSVEQEIISRGFVAWSARSMMQQMNIFFLVIQGIFGGIGAIALIVAAFGIANTMTMAIYERTREIGLMKAVGATNRDVMSVFLVEAGGIGLLGGVGGVLLGVGLGKLIDLIAGTYLAAQAVQSGATPSDVAISIIYTPLWLPIFALLFSAFVGVVSGIYPAVRAASLNPIAALKYE